MKILDYKYTVSTIEKTDRFELLENRNSYMTMDYSKQFKEWFESMNFKGKIAVLYVGGIGIHSSELRNYEGSYECSVEVKIDGPAVKNTQAYMMHRYIGLMPCRDNVIYANISGGTCASSMQSIHEAEKLLEEGIVDTVIVIAEEKTNFNTIRIFHEHNIEVKPGEGFACIVFSRDGKYTVRDTKWAYSYDRNPFLVSAKGYEQVKTDADIVKGHKTGTEQNDTSEKEVFGDVQGYKDTIGHCQGASGLIELCMVLDDDSMQGNILCVASGLGGFYGSCVVEK